ncbi:mitotic checkpoint regulator, MAD2B-interacting-domain-containing protein [Desarmillaria tabescens]|uniref:Mitotic checkpoint regulator, MAD2B-interacting-domain-containing protein n=1 Tax=Armillaria tabescens TaxID=1929756 RepID=A0AA39KER9_ARMTA|nr:mitotic checkpoint regulator, MAD2B-interacting-domain-containing protein [Desarmillaria tabescens]KAK0459760.1 mitotic checkpoint regulator, MAD2B-interacting-domain-containing protein [Desarmillaria tabescens]
MILSVYWHNLFGYRVTLFFLHLGHYIALSYRYYKKVALDSMLGLEDYGSGSESDGETETKPQTSSGIISQSLKPQSKTTSSSSIALPPPRTKKRIAIALPSLKSVKDDGDEEEISKPVAKKPRLESGAGTSSLMSMLPAPKQKNPIPAPTERVLGGGKGQALSFNLPSAPSADEGEGEAPGPGPSIPFLPPSLAKGRSNISLEEERPKPAARTAAPAPALDFFSLGASSSSTPKPTDPSSSSISISSAPAIPTFEPPEPTMNDEYPGYYQLPSGTWKAHEPEYYAKFLKRWQKEYNDQVRALEKGVAKGFEGMEKDGMEDVDAKTEMERAKKEIKEREERKAITKGAGDAPEKPKMNINASKLSGIARSRHQLSTMLKEAYENREVLEEKIAEGRRNRKEAGNKYGF